MTQLPPSPPRQALQGAYAQARGGAPTPGNAPPGAPPPGGPGAGAPGDVPDQGMQQVISQIAGKLGALEDIVKQLVQKVGGVGPPPGAGAPPGAAPGGPPMPPHGAPPGGPPPGPPR